MGISGSKKIMDEFEIQTVIGGGTTIKGTKWLG
jgi:anti-sigma regulatory factor (Ser/Thr protein kinase)